MNTTNTPRIGYSYIRFSSKQQASGDSLRRQTASTEAYCAEHNISLDDRTFQDLGVSAFTGKHTQADSGLGLFLNAVRAGKVPTDAVLIVESLDRLSRQSVYEALGQFLDILRAGVSIVTLMDGKHYDPNNKTDMTVDLIISITIMARAHEESETKSTRIRAAWDRKRELMASDNTFKGSAICPFWLVLQPDRKAFIEREPHANTLRLMFKLYIDHWGYGKITRYLNENGYLSSRGIGWSLSTVKSAINNKAVTGEYQPYITVNGKLEATGDPITGYYPTVISEADYYKAQAIRTVKATEEHTASGRKGGSFSNIVSNFATCKHCGSSMHFINKGAKYKYLICSQSRTNRGCLSHSETTVLYPEVESAVIEMMMQDGFRHYLKTAPADTSKVQIDLAVIRGKLAEANTKLESFISVSPDFSIPVIAKQFTTLQTVVSGYQDDIKDLESQLVNESDNVPSESLLELWQVVADIMQVQIGSQIPSELTPDELFSKRSKLNRIIRKAFGSLTIGKIAGQSSRPDRHTSSNKYSIVLTTDRETFTVDKDEYKKRKGWFMSYMAE